ALENKIESAIDGAMRNQLSKEKDGRAAVFCRVNPDPVTYASLYAQNEISSPNFNIFVENKVYVFVSMRPKFCNRYIDVYIGFTATT
ncbi:MAG TPA: hypothetical protein VK173_04405, partial [Lacibacter sp.]|nr:hypothetical protein [Lacibacter sp.]